MSLGVAELDQMPEAEAAAVLAACCGSPRWVRAMVTRRPFGSRDAVLAAADNCWLALPRADRLEAFAQHPRIGERVGAEPQGTLGDGWSAKEQSGMDSAAALLREELARVNRDYEARFGYVYIVCASGKSGEDLLRLARERLDNDPEAELAIATREQQRIMRLRLEKLLSP